MRVIVTGSISAAGCLKQAGIADKVSAFEWHLADGPTPDVDGSVASLLDEVDGAGADLELWFDGGPASQLDLCLIVDAIGRRPGLRTRVRHFSLGTARIGEMNPAVAQQLGPELRPLDDDAIRVARAAWSAFRQPTPEPFCDLLGADTTPLPDLAPAILALLAELPDAVTGLTGCQRAMLEAARDGEPAGRCIGRAAHQGTLGYFRVGGLFLDLFGAPAALTGTSERAFDLGLHLSEARRRALFDVVPTPTRFGEQLLAGEADFATTHPIDRWWGGTHLTGGNLWRFDDERRVVVRAEID